jgi:2-phospho-L-lactate/phosphoenolpyruvate guanylyltransferase
VRTLAILPVKRFGLAKQRLAERLGPAQREALAQAMVSDVLGALATSRRLDGVLVITNEPALAAIAKPLGATIAPDRRDAGQSAATAVGAAYAKRKGYARVLMVPGDCPALERDELDALLDAHTESPSVVIVPDRHGTGTNALLLAPPDIIAPAFGPGSFERHRELAAAAGVACAVARPETLLLDIDTAADLAALMAGSRRRAPRTRAAYAAASQAG